MCVVRDATDGGGCAAGQCRLPWRCACRGGAACVAMPTIASGTLPAATTQSTSSAQRSRSQANVRSIEGLTEEQVRQVWGRWSRSWQTGRVHHAGVSSGYSQYHCTVFFVNGRANEIDLANEEPQTPIDALAHEELVAFGSAAPSKNGMGMNHVYRTLAAASELRIVCMAHGSGDGNRRSRRVRVSSCRGYQDRDQVSRCRPLPVLQRSSVRALSGPYNPPKFACPTPPTLSALFSPHPDRRGGIPSLRPRR